MNLKNDGLPNRRAKVVCTLGPSTDTLERVNELVDAGMNVARLNMSHGDHEDHLRRLNAVRQAAELAGRPIGVFADLQGPKIRLGRFVNGAEQINPGDRFTITIDDVPGTAERASTTLKTLTEDVKPGDQILINDGAIELRALEVTDTDVVTEVIIGGQVSNNKGINLPGVAVSVPALSAKDADDLRWALEHGVDMVALSFVRSASDVDDVHAIMDEVGKRIPVIAKIEKPQALAAIDDIVVAFDAIMVARGDLGVELPLEDVPSAQKRIIQAARHAAKPVIVATQMLESMISAPRPTRAEVSDVANAILDGADAVMLSGETAMGAWPIEAVDTMARIIRKTESMGLDQIDFIDWDPHTTSGIIAKAAVDVAEQIEAKYLVAFTKTGDTALRLTRLRSEIPVCAFSPYVETAQKMTLVWGVKSFTTPEYVSVDAMVDAVLNGLVGQQMATTGDKVVIVSGNPKHSAGKTNALRVAVVP
ncbi:pyruvate kinase [Propioniciclava sp.]|uniref:pyruvate kinase n=1 Tax=Propioniciclava sp. TaxID=2038686 RepID=UPI00262398CF|nr:pyruvate kinase [Propioniciclava sp.]